MRYFRSGEKNQNKELLPCCRKAAEVHEVYAQIPVGFYSLKVKGRVPTQLQIHQVMYSQKRIALNTASIFQPLRKERRGVQPQR